MTAAIYTGESTSGRAPVTPDGLITDRAIIRDTPPDILLPNNQMLNQLRLRPNDQNVPRTRTLISRRARYNRTPD